MLSQPHLTLCHTLSVVACQFSSNAFLLLGFSYPHDPSPLLCFHPVTRPIGPLLLVLVLHTIPQNGVFNFGGPLGHHTSQGEGTRQKQKTKRSEATGNKKSNKCLKTSWKTLEPGWRRWPGTIGTWHLRLGRSGGVN